MLYFYTNSTSENNNTAHSRRHTENKFLNVTGKKHPTPILYLDRLRFCTGINTQIFTLLTHAHVQQLGC